MRLRSERAPQLEARIAKDAYDVEAWQMLLSEAQSAGTQEQVRDMFERFLERFPSSGRHWALYVEFELHVGRTDLAEAIFARSLRDVLSVDLWRAYLTYVRQTNETAGEAGRSTVIKAYETALQYIGVDKDAGGIWSDYVNFIKAGEASTTYEEQQRMDALRRVYRRAIAIPLTNVEALWREYDAFENGLSRVTAKKFLAEQSPIYMTARAAVRELKQMAEMLNRSSLPRPSQWTEKELNQLSAWNRYLAWERQDPLRIEDAATRSARISFAYKQAVMTMRFYSEIWFAAATFAAEEDRHDEAIALYKSGIEVLPTSCLLHFALAELYEERKRVPEARAVYETFLETLNGQITGMEAEAKAEAEQVGAASAHSAGNRRSPNQVMARWKQRIDVAKRTCTLAWVMMMRFARRSEGIKTARQIFSRARKSPHITYHLFVASALMEYHCSKDAGVAGRVFELGLKSFGDAEYVREYLAYLIRTNDDNNTRALFERTIHTLPTEKADPTWRLFLAYESDYGELTGAREAESRYLTAFPNG
ncbi:hypothetical protein THASP1DRAFT_14564, partial [Thamnocephalis sphaerospora]